jgi:hypothetical protein
VSRYSEGGWWELVRQRMERAEASERRKLMTLGGPKTELYRRVKSVWGCERYIREAWSRKSVAFKCSLRSGTCDLEVEMGRGVCRREERVCRMCRVECESVAHFVMRCDRLTELRREWVGKVSEVLRASDVRWDEMSEDERVEVALGSDVLVRGEELRRRVDKVAREGLWGMKKCRDRLLGGG